MVEVSRAVAASKMDAVDAPSISEQFAAYWATASLADMPDAAVKAAKRALLDTLAAGVAGGREPVVDAVADGARQATGAGEAVLWGRQDRLGPAGAALVNGTAAHALELDDFGGCGHSGAVVVPAVCALADTAQANGQQVLLSVIAGYDIASRVLVGSGGYRPHNERGWHSTGTCGTFGAAAASAKLLGFAPHLFVQALGIAGSFNGGTWAFLADGALTKRFHPGKAAETGVSAALLARSGLTGPSQIFDAPWGGFYSTYAAGFATPELATEGLGSDFHILKSGVKIHACCRTLHAAVDAAIEIVAGSGRAPEAITRMIVHGNDQTKRQFARTDVRNLLEAQFSAPYCMAVAASSGAATLDRFMPLRTDDAEIRRLMALTEIATDRVLASHEYPSLEVHFADGYREHKQVRFATGAPEAPVSDDRLTDKAVGLMAPVLGDRVTGRLVDTILSLEQVDHFAEVVRLLAPSL